MKQYPNIRTIEFFNWWRENYSTLEEHEHRYLLDEMELNYPSQLCFDKRNYELLFNEILPVSKVLEIGGWKGDLAKHCFEKNYPIISWFNLEVCANAIKKTNCINKKYFTINPLDFRWWKNKHYINALYSKPDVCIMSHFIEHVKWNDLMLILGQIGLAKIKYLYLEAPLKHESIGWNNYLGTHILEVGWKQVINFVTQNMPHKYVIKNKLHNAYLFELEQIESN